MDDVLAPLVAVTFLSGLSYGFAGLGSMVFVPLAAILLPPQQAAAQMALCGLGSAVTLLPRAWGAADRPRVLTMLAPAALGLAAGAAVLKRADAEALRWVVAGLVAATLAALMAGWRMRLAPGRGMLAAVGGGSGLIGGATGLLGPVILLFNLAGTDRAGRVRANTVSFLTLLTVLYVPVLALQGLIGPEVLWRGLILVPVYMLATRLGQAVFDPERERLYRHAGYAAVGLAVLAGLPLWR